MEPFRSHRGLVLNSSQGFTLVELLVVFAIIVTISGVVLTSQSSFNRTLVLANTAYDIALTLRSAETFGLGGRATGGTADAGYGVHFERGAAGSFILFADTHPSTSGSCTTPDCKPGNSTYSVNDTLVQTYTLGNGITVSDFCAYSSGVASCAVAHGAGLSSLDIVFARPNPDAFITAGGSSYTTACLTLTSPQGGSRAISITSSGQIVPNAASCL